MQVNTHSEVSDAAVPSCWVVSEGMAGTENQCLGVADALGVVPVIKRISLRQPWKMLSPFLGAECACTFTPPLEGPWPDIVLASGRKSIAAARYIKKASAGRSLIVQIQDPRISPRHFDIVAVPAHDPTRGPNVVVTDGAANRVNETRLAAAKAAFAGIFSPLPGPRVAVLIGGSSKAHRMTPAIAGALGQQLAHLARTQGASLMITASRRTDEPSMAALRAELAGVEAFIWDGTGDNPYQGMLAWADYIMVTSDSVSMISDAGTTGKPVYMVPLEGGSARFERFYDGLMAKGVLRRFDGRLEHWSYPPLNAARQIADEIRKAMGQRQK